MRGRTLLAVVLGALTVVGVASAAVATPNGPVAAGMTRSAQLETGVLAELNTIRRAHDLVPLRLSQPLAQAAVEHAREMGQDGYFKHDSADGSPFWKRVERYYPSSTVRYWSVGENLLWSSPTVDAAGALKIWMNSPEHRANILTPRWREIGIAAVDVPAAPGAYDGLDVTIVATDFGVRH